jgi:hypothetical protein
MTMLKFIHSINNESGIHAEKPAFYFRQDHVSRSITPLLQYSNKLCRQGSLSFEHPQKMTIKYNCNGVNHAQI